MITRPFRLSATDETMRALTREEYYRTTSWLRYERLIAESVEPIASRILADVITQAVAFACRVIGAEWRQRAKALNAAPQGEKA